MNMNAKDTKRAPWGYREWHGAPFQMLTHYAHA